MKSCNWKASCISFFKETLTKTYQYTKAAYKMVMTTTTDGANCNSFITHNYIIHWLICNSQKCLSFQQSDTSIFPFPKVLCPTRMVRPSSYHTSLILQVLQIWIKPIKSITSPKFQFIIISYKGTKFTYIFLEHLTELDHSKYYLQSDLHRRASRRSMAASSDDNWSLSRSVHHQNFQYTLHRSPPWLQV